MTNPTTTTRRRRTLTSIAGLVVVAALIAAALFFANQSPAEAPEPTPTNTSTPTPSATIEPDAAPTGCLGGVDRTAEMVVDAATTAPQTSNGGVEVAASFVRWIQQYPYPSASDAELVTREVLGEDAFTDDLGAYFSRSPDLSGGIVAPGDTYSMTTVSGVWHLESASADTVVSAIGTGFVLDGAISPSLRSSITITTVWDGDRWRVTQADGTRTTEDLFSIGREFTGGC